MKGKEMFGIEENGFFGWSLVIGFNTKKRAEEGLKLLKEINKGSNYRIRKYLEK